MSFKCCVQLERRNFQAWYNEAADWGKKTQCLFCKLILVAYVKYIYFLKHRNKWNQFSQSYYTLIHLLRMVSKRPC